MGIRKKKPSTILRFPNAKPGTMEWWWDNPPEPFNEDYDPRAAERFEKTTENLMKEDGYHEWSRSDRALRWAVEYNRLKEAGM